MPVGETGHARSRVLFVRLDGVEVVVIRWWLSKDFLESGTARLDIGYVRDGFPYDVGEIMRNHEMLFKCFVLCHDVIPMNVSGKVVMSGTS